MENFLKIEIPFENSANWNQGAKLYYMMLSMIEYRIPWFYTRFILVNLMMGLKTETV
jgi:hypothetical protein